MPIFRLSPGRRGVEGYVEGLSRGSRVEGSRGFEGDQMIRSFEGCRGVGRGVEVSRGRGYIEPLDICSVEPDVERSRGGRRGVTQWVIKC